MLALAFLFASMALPAAPPATTDAATLIQQVAHTAEVRWPDGDTREENRPHLWNYTRSVLLTGFEDAAAVSPVSDYNRYVRAAMDKVVSPDGHLSDFPNEPHSLDQIAMGRQLVDLYNQTHDERYATAAKQVFNELMLQPRNRAGGFWHKQIYPAQMWLDGLYMAEPFYANYAVTFHQPNAFEDITHQFVVMEDRARDPKSGLLYHGWDESHQQAWANKDTGLSSQFWARSIGWYAMALVDTLPYYPANAPGRKQLLAILNRTSDAIIHAQDPQTGLWWQVLDRVNAPRNYPEASSSAMFIYVLEKGVRLGYLPAKDLTPARKAWDNYCAKLLQHDPNGAVHITSIVHSGGLGGTPYRSGSYDYYTGEHVVSDDPQGVGAFLMAASETARLQHNHQATK